MDNALPTSIRRRSILVEVVTERTRWSDAPSSTSFIAYAPATNIGESLTELPRLRDSNP